jgi:D-Tyr-tRNAtyr deacylase
MARKTGKSGKSSPSGSGFSVKVYRGDAKTLLAFNLPDRASAKNLAGFTIQVAPPGKSPDYLWNRLQFETPGNHAQVATEPAYSSVNAPFHKFRWLHVPGSAHSTDVPFGTYTYGVTPRFFDDKQSLLAIDLSRTVETKVDVQPFQTKGLKLGFTRGFVQSQAFADHFGVKAPLRPKGNDLTYDTSQIAGKNSKGESFTFEDQYAWSGFTARVQIFAVLDEVLADKSLHLDLFAYDLSEPRVVDSLLQLAKQGRVRVILDNASLHKSTAKKDAPEDLFEKAFDKAAKGGAELKRGKFGRYSHDKVMIVSDGSGAQKVLTGSTNFSVTGVYVNSNHVLVFNDPDVASKYLDVFDASWDGDVKLKAFVADKLSSEVFKASSKQTPAIEVTFSPHDADFAEKVLDGLVARVQQEAKTKNGSVFFAVMVLDDTATGPVYPALRKLHESQNIYSYGISDTSAGTNLYSPRSKRGVLVTGKPGSTQLPPPFNQIRQVGAGHQVHHKFVVCGFNGANPVVYCGSSNLALGGEQQNGDNLIAVHDGDVATVFAIEALGLVDHFDFLDKAASKAASVKGKAKAAAATKAAKTDSKRQLAAAAAWFLGTTDAWVESYFDPADLHCVDRQLFG